MVKLGELKKKVLEIGGSSQLPLPLDRYDVLTAYIFDVQKVSAFPPSRVGAYIPERDMVVELVLGPTVSNDIKNEIDEIVTSGKICRAKVYILKDTIRVDHIEDVKPIDTEELNGLDLPWHVYSVTSNYLVDPETNERVFLPYNLTTINTAKLPAVKATKVAALAITNTDVKGRKKIRYVYFVELPEGEASEVEQPEEKEEPQRNMNEEHAKDKANEEKASDKDMLDEYFRELEELAGLDLGDEQQ